MCCIVLPSSQLHKKVKKLNEVAEDLKQQCSDTKFYAMMYCVSHTTQDT